MFFFDPTDWRYPHRLKKKRKRRTKNTSPAIYVKFSAVQSINVVQYPASEVMAKSMPPSKSQGKSPQAILSNDNPDKLSVPMNYYSPSPVLPF